MSLMTMSPRLNGFYGRAINHESGVNELARIL